jgi:hypothetical protein
MAEKIIVTVIQKRKEEDSYLVVCCGVGKSSLRTSNNFTDQFQHAIEFGRLMGAPTTSVLFTAEAIKLMFPQ